LLLLLSNTFFYTNGNVWVFKIIVQILTFYIGKERTKLCDLRPTKDKTFVRL
jgi:hypothetical protein